VFRVAFDYLLQLYVVMLHGAGQLLKYQLINDVIIIFIDVIGNNIMYSTYRKYCERSKFLIMSVLAVT